MAIPATQLRPGMIIKHNNDLHSVFSVEHRLPATCALSSRPNCATCVPAPCSSTASVRPTPSRRSMSTKSKWSFSTPMATATTSWTPTNYEQTHLTREILGDAVEYLTPNLQIKVEFFDGKAVGIELPQTVELTVVETEPGLKSATASSVTKPAKTETGLVVQVPPFINEGEKIRWIRRKARTFESVGAARARSSVIQTDLAFCHPERSKTAKLRYSDVSERMS